MTILYIDDDSEDIEIFHEAVKAIDTTVQYITASNAVEALAFLQRTETLPDHVILDINMPGMDGKSCLKEIRKEKKFDSVNVVIYSTNCFPKDIEQIESLGAVFIQKPNSFSDLCAMIQKLVKKVDEH